MRNAIALVSLAFGAALCADALGVLPAEYSVPEVPEAVLGSAGGALVVLALALLARDHRGSEMLSAMLLLAFSAMIGWLTFYGTEGIIEGGIPFIPPSVGDALGRLLFGFGVVACVGMAVLALRRLLR